MNIPLEEEEQITFVEWLEFKNIKFSAIPSSTYTKSWNQKRKNKATGLRKGLPDLLIFISEEQSNTSKASILFVEMKRIKGAYATPEQKEWIKCLNTVGNVQCEVCKGANKAIEFISKFIN